MHNIVTILILFLFLDTFYLKAVKSRFSSLIRKIQKSDMVVDIYAALACYLVMTFGFYYFIVKDKRSVIDAAILGFVIYAVFDFTNMAIFKHWDLTTSIIDATWGAILFAATRYLLIKLEPYTKQIHL
jgi:uncharacterized membrane protein